jgi:hypothetical protein
MLRLIPNIKTIAATSAVLLTTTLVNAGVSGSLWQNDFSNDASVIPAGTPDVTFTVPGIDFASGALYTIGEFLASGGATVLTGASELGNAANWIHISLNGSLYLSAGVNNFNIQHDDGLVLSIAGIGTVVNEPGPTPPVVTGFVVNAPAAGTYNYTLEYNECCGAPAELAWTYPNGGPVGAPDGGATVMLLGVGMTGLALFARRQVR